METIEETHRYLDNSLPECSNLSEEALLRSPMSPPGRLLKDNQRCAAVRERGWGEKNSHLAGHCYYVVRVVGRC